MDDAIFVQVFSAVHDVLEIGLGFAFKQPLLFLEEAEEIAVLA
jgi:hypothetical protein